MSSAGLRTLFVAAALLGAAPLAARPASGSMLVFTDVQGRPATFNVVFPDAPQFVPAAIAPETVAAEFSALCLATNFDPAALRSAAPQSTLGLAFLHLRYSGDRNTGPFDIDGWHGRSASARIWNGNPLQLRRLPTLVTMGGLQMTGPLTLDPQCNVDVASTSLTDWNALLAALTAAIGRPPTRAGSGRRWAEARWEPAAGAADAVFIGVRLDGLNRPSQTIHIGIVRPTNPEQR